MAQKARQLNNRLELSLIKGSGSAMPDVKAAQQAVRTCREKLKRLQSGHETFSTTKRSTMISYFVADCSAVPVQGASMPRREWCGALT